MGPFFRAAALDLGVGRAQHGADVARDRQRMRRERGLVVTLALAGRQRAADHRAERTARRFDEVLGRFDHRLGAEACARHLHEGVEQPASRSVGQARAVKVQRPGFVAVAQVVDHAAQAGVGRQRLDAKLLEQVEDQALGRIFGPQRCMPGRVAVLQAQRQAVGRAAERVEVVVRQRRVQVRREQRQRVSAAVQAARAEVQVALAGDRTDRGDAELFDVLLAAWVVRGGFGCHAALNPILSQRERA